MSRSSSFGPHAQQRIEIAQRVADSHRGIDDASLLSFVSGSTVEDLADDRSDVDMSVVFDALPDREVLRAACQRVGDDWFWSDGDTTDGLVVSFRVDGIEVQIGYANHAGLVKELEDVIVRHDPASWNAKLVEGVLKALPLAGAERLAALQQRLAAFPPELARAMVEKALAPPVSWRGMSQLPYRDTTPLSRELQVDGCYRVLQMLCGINRVYFTRFQVKRVHRLAAKLQHAPPQLADRIDALLSAPMRDALIALHALEGEVLELVAQQLPVLDLAVVRVRRARYQPD
jgi:hypothetical protein